MASRSTSPLDLLPHGEEFRFLTDVGPLNPQHSGQARWTIEGSEPFLKGHFPGDPLVPGVLMAEAAAQLCGMVLFATPDGEPQTPPPRATLAQVNVKFLAEAVPPIELQLHAELRRVIDRLALFDIRVEADGRPIASGAITLARPEADQ